MRRPHPPPVAQEKWERAAGGPRQLQLGGSSHIHPADPTVQPREMTGTARLDATLLYVLSAYLVAPVPVPGLDPSCPLSNFLAAILGPQWALGMGQTRHALGMSLSGHRGPHTAPARLGPLCDPLLCSAVCPLSTPGHDTSALTTSTTPPQLGFTAHRASDHTLIFSDPLHPARHGWGTLERSPTQALGPPAHPIARPCGTCSPQPQLVGAAFQPLHPLSASAPPRDACLPVEPLPQNSPRTQGAVEKFCWMSSFSQGPSGLAGGGGRSTRTTLDNVGGIQGAPARCSGTCL